MFQSHISKLLQELNQQSDSKVKSWWETYVKGSAPFRGVKMAAIRKCLHKWHKENIEGVLDLEQQLELANDEVEKLEATIADFKDQVKQTLAEQVVDINVC